MDKQRRSFLCGKRRVDKLGIALGVRRRVEPGLFVVVWSPVCSLSCGAQFVRRRVSAGVGVGAFGGGSVCVRESRAARTRGADGTQGKFLFLLFHFHLVFWGVCVCVRPRPIK